VSRHTPPVDVREALYYEVWPLAELAGYPAFVMNKVEVGPGWNDSGGWQDSMLFATLVQLARTLKALRAAYPQAAAALDDGPQVPTWPLLTTPVRILGQEGDHE
jgi:hypothetical protein